MKVVRDRVALRPGSIEILECRYGVLSLLLVQLSLDVEWRILSQRSERNDRNRRSNEGNIALSLPFLILCRHWDRVAFYLQTTRSAPTSIDVNQCKHSFRLARSNPFEWAFSAKFYRHVHLFGSGDSSAPLRTHSLWTPHFIRLFEIISFNR